MCAACAALGAARVATHRDGYLLDVEPDRVDALRFSRLLSTAAETPDLAVRHDRLSEALALWRGTPFGGVRSDWLARVVLPSLQAATQQAALAAAERLGDPAEQARAHRNLAFSQADLGSLRRRAPPPAARWSWLARSAIGPAWVGRINAATW